MAHLSAAPRDRRASVNLGKLPAVPVTEQPVTAKRKAKLLLRGGHGGYNGVVGSGTVPGQRPSGKCRSTGIIIGEQAEDIALSDNSFSGFEVDVSDRRQA